MKKRRTGQNTSWQKQKKKKSITFDWNECKDRQKLDGYEVCETCGDRFICWTSRGADVSIKDVLDALSKAVQRSAIPLSDFNEMFKNVENEKDN